MPPSSHSDPDDEMSVEQIMDGLALWEEHKPHSGEDWVKVAERFIAAGDTPEDSSPLFAGLVQAVREREEAHEALRSLWIYLRLDDRDTDHTKFGEACGVDACILCLAAATAKQALHGS